ncbi:TPA: hypothetical protein N3A31_004199 [Salmonella enterica subsp. houtenae serovar 43:z4,z32:-]|nr:hypothetical protein [Salmonella enterica subsp. houtenae serovar 43:z4,z32:-]
MKTIDNDILFMVSGTGSNGGNNGGGLGAAVGNRVGSEIGGRIGEHMHEAPSVSHTPAGIGTGNHW